MTFRAEREQRLVDELVVAGRALARTGLVTAFGHVSVRSASSELLITPPEPLGGLTADSDWRGLDVAAAELPTGVPREAWIHLAIARGRAEVGAICRAQPPTATALASAGVPILALHGQGALLGPLVPVFDDPVLVRDETRAAALAARMGNSPALVMRGNGAVTVGANIGEAVARMWVLEASARMNSIAAAAGKQQPLSLDEQGAWQHVASEILDRIWHALSSPIVNVKDDGTIQVVPDHDVVIH
jgi:HCOMODA/2-hydroxy-3-carboxy-muconic semialdehyde decarboxylase